MKASTTILSVALALRAASAQVWGTQGAWQQVLPSPLSTPPNLALQHAAFVPGMLLVMGNATSPAGTQSDLDVYKFNIATRTWTAPYDFVSAVGMQAPFLVAYGGLAVAVDELQPNVLAVIDTQAPDNSGWARIQVQGAPIGRVAQRFLLWGSSLFMFGGFNPTNVPKTQSNDLFVLDLSTAVTQPTALNTWLPVSPAVDPATGFVAGYPPARVSYSWTPFEIGSFLYGGISYGAVGGDPFQQCLFVPNNAPQDPNCHWHENIWGLLPSYTANGLVPATAWFRMVRDMCARACAHVPLALVGASERVRENERACTRTSARARERARVRENESACARACGRGAHAHLLSSR